MINAHTHLYSGLAPLGMPTPATPPADFVQILEHIWWRLDRAIDAASLRASARYYVAQALLSGTTGLIDHHESPAFIEGSLDVLADACQRGMRAVLTYGATERNGGRNEAVRGLEECRRFITTNRRPLVEGVVGCTPVHRVRRHDPRGRRALPHAGVPLHIHLAEDSADGCRREAARLPGPLERLITLDACRRASILAHGVHLTPEEVAQAEAHGAWLVQNPRSNRGNWVGFARHLAEHRHTALGTDGYPSDLWTKRMPWWVEARMHSMLPAVAEVRLAGSEELGRLLFGEGSSADRVARADGRVMEVEVAGHPVVLEGRLATGDPEEIEAVARTEAARLWERMRAL